MVIAITESISRWLAGIAPLVKMPAHHYIVKYYQLGLIL